MAASLTGVKAFVLGVEDLVRPLLQHCADRERAGREWNLGRG